MNKNTRPPVEKLIKYVGLRNISRLLLFVALASAAEIFMLQVLLPIISGIDGTVTVSRSFGTLLGASSSQLSSQQNLAIEFMILAVFVGVTRLYVQKESSRLAFSLGGRVAKEIFRNAVHFTDFSKSSDIAKFIDGISNKSVSIVYQVFLPALNIATSLIIICCILGTMLWINFKFTLMLVAAILVIYYVVSTLVSQRLHSCGTEMNTLSTDIVSRLRETIGSVKELRLYCREESVIVGLDTLQDRLRTVQANISYLGVAPRYVVETAGYVFVAIGLFYLATKGGMTGHGLAIIGAILFGAQRILPLAQQIFTAWSNIRANTPVLHEVLSLTESNGAEKFDPRIKVSRKVSPNGNTIAFKSDGIVKTSPEGEFSVAPFEFQIPVGTVVALVGESGIGKSTIAEYLVGFGRKSDALVSVDATLNIDDQKLISYVPQRPFILDQTLEFNVTLEESVTTERHMFFLECLSRAAIDQTGTDRLGEGGTRLSGGQCQRVGLARALFRDTFIRVLDEVTSGLDRVTEEKVIRGILKDKDSKITIFVTHSEVVKEFANVILEVVRDGNKFDSCLVVKYI